MCFHKNLLQQNISWMVVMRCHQLNCITRAPGYIILIHPHRKGRRSPLVVALVLEYFVGVSSKAASSSGRGGGVNFGSLPHMPVNILIAVIRSPRSRRLCKE